MYSYRAPSLLILFCREAFIPKLLKIKHHIKLCKKILIRASMALLKERIRETRQGLDILIRDLLKLRLFLSDILILLDWFLLDRILFSQFLKIYTSKFKLRNSSPFVSNQVEKPQKIVVKQESTSCHIHFLLINIHYYSVDWIFHLPPTKIVTEDIISAVESNDEDLELLYTRQMFIRDQRNNLGWANKRLEIVGGSKRYSTIRRKEPKANRSCY